MNLVSAIIKVLTRHHDNVRCKRLHKSLTEGVADYFSSHPLFFNGDGTDKIRKACYADIDRAFKEKDLVALEAFATHFTVISGVRLTAICIDSLREIKRTINDELMEAALVKANSLRNSWMCHVGYAGVPPRESAALTLGFILSYPEREDAILSLVEKRGLPESNNLSVLLQQAVDVPALSEGAL